jgi:hypothetical protein
MSRKPLEQQDWLGENPLDKLEGYDPLRTVLERVRAQRTGSKFIPSFDSAEAGPDPETPSASVDDVRRLLVEANRELSPVAMKVLATILGRDKGTAALSDLCRATKLPAESVRKGFEECLKLGWLERNAFCSHCHGEVTAPVDGSPVECGSCHHTAVPEYLYAVLMPLGSPPPEARPVALINGSD